MHTASVEEDGVCHGEDRAGLPLPLDAVFNLPAGSGCRARRHTGRRGLQGGRWRSSRWPSAAVEASQQPGRDTNSLRNEVYWMHDAHEHPSEVLAAKKHNLA